MWMGKVSAWGALAMGAVFAGLATLQVSWGFVVSWVLALIATLLIAASYRTLRQLSGGLRLLAGAWGLAAGMMLEPFSLRPPLDVSLHDTYYLVADPLTGWMGVALTVTPLVGLALTVLHKEKKG